MPRFMIALSIFSMLALGLFSPGMAHDRNETGIKSGYPYATLAAEEIDMGKLPKGSSNDGFIFLTNQGEPDLLIARIRSSCGLVIPSWPDAPISQGDTVRIRFRYNTNRLGPFERKITIHTNAWQKNLFVTVKGEVIPEDPSEL